MDHFVCDWLHHEHSPQIPRYWLTQTRKGSRCEICNLVVAPLPYLLKPCRILQQRTSDCDKIELVTL